MKTQNIFYLILLITLASGACKKKDTNRPTVMVEFDNVAGNADLAFNTNYVNSSGETFKVSKFTYYISNVSLTKTDGKVFTVAQDDSYFLIKEDVATSQKVELKNVPEGDYKSISFIVGVDSVRNCSPIDKRTGALDIANGMYWIWNTGYIFSKLEGSSAVATNNIIEFHLGGFGGYSTRTANNIRKVTVPFTGLAQVRNGAKTDLGLTVDALKVFGTNVNGMDNRISIATSSVIASAAASMASTLAGNYQNEVFNFRNVQTNPK